MAAVFPVSAACAVLAGISLAKREPHLRTAIGLRIVSFLSPFRSLADHHEPLLEREDQPVRARGSAPGRRI
jgi:hypothetical protein